MTSIAIAEPVAQRETRLLRSALVWALVAWAGFAFLPWYWTNNLGLFDWLGRIFDETTGSGIILSTSGGKWWLLPILLPLAAALRPVGPNIPRPLLGNWLVIAGAAGLAWITFEGFALGLHGWNTSWLAALFGAPGPRQIGMGAGAGVTAFALLMILCQGLAAKGWCRGDAFVTGSIGVVIGLVGLFVFLPVFKILISAIQDDDGNVAFALFTEKLFDYNIWGLGCLGGGIQCGVAWNTVFLAIFVGVAATLLGLSFALLATRSNFRAKGALRILTILPIITPPFVIGLALILLFGRNGAITLALADLFGIPRSRWIYGFSGVAMAQILAFTPLAFLVLVGVVQGISPTLEEASQTLRATRWTTFRTITWPLMRPGLANAFLLCFVESMADFGNPLVLGGNFDVLSIRIFFAVVGAAHDQGRAAVLAIVLLAFTLGAFYAQNAWLGKKAYTTVSGKGDSGLPTPLPKRVAAACYGTALPWAAFTILIYITIFLGGLVEAIGRDYTLTLKHYIIAFGVEHTDRGWQFLGSAWDSFFATIQISAISAPLTAAMGLVTAYLLARQTFKGRRAFEFGTLLSFAIPGTVIGVGYILAFNVPPIEITGTAFILIVCFVFRNMPVGVRAGLATLSQIDKSLDEASLTLGARSFTTFRRVMMPLLRPAIVAGLVYSFVRAMTAVSAVIFLVSAKYNMATAYIVGRADAGEYGVAIAYSSALIIVMLVVITFIQLAVGERRLGRRASTIAVGH